MKKILYIICGASLILFGCSKSEIKPPTVPDGEKPVPPPLVKQISDEALLDYVQAQTFKYFWDLAETNSKAARERYVSGSPGQSSNVVATGGFGFGLMAILVGIERGFVTRAEAVSRLQTILEFFENADCFHGAWPHWLDGNTGNVLPFSTRDNGADLVETSFLVQGLICIQEYFKNGTLEEKLISQKAEVLWKGVEWDWFTNEQNKLLWHWSPTYNFDINLGITGYNECLITYVLAAASPDHSITANVYKEGWARNGSMVATNSKYGYPLLVKHAGNQEYGGPLFWSHYSYLGLDPRNLADQYADYWEVNVNHTKINYSYCVENPSDRPYYGSYCWGLTASYTMGANGGLSYAAHSPSQDYGVISPTAAVSAINYTPEESLNAMHFFYNQRNILVGEAGFYDAFKPSLSNFWVAKAYLAIDQGPQIIMIENYRLGLLWNLFMQNEDVQNGLNKLGFTY